jgi:hypothetical protein
VRDAQEGRGLRVEHVVPAVPSAPMLARRELARTLRSALPAYRFEDTIVAVSELITWGFLAHGRRERDRIGITVEVDDRRIRLTVEQSEPRVHPSQPLPSSKDEDGPHLARLGRVADDWGIEAGPPSRVWFDVRRAVETRRAVS